MRYHLLACDYDGTVASEGRIDPATLDLLERVRSSGRKLVLVTGRELSDLQRVCGELDRFDRVVAENGAVLYDPGTHQSRALVEAPPLAFAAALRARGVAPLSVGTVIVATREPHEAVCLETIRDMALELHIVFNKGAVMVLPSGCNKALGLRAALADLAISPHNVVGVGDAENDHAFLSECELAVAVANALPSVKERADIVLEEGDGTGILQLTSRLLATDLDDRRAGPSRHAVSIGTADDGDVMVEPYTAPVMIAGTSGGGKSTLAMSLLEQLVEHEYQVCIVDPEGDYVAFPGATVLGDAKRPPAVPEVVEVLADPRQNAVVNMLSIGIADRPAFFGALLPRVLELRAAAGRPHWLVLDETHHLAGAAVDARALALPQEPHGVLMITVHPDQVSPVLLRTLGTVIAIGAEPDRTLAQVAAATGDVSPRVPADALPAGEAMVWERATGLAPRRFRVRPPHAEHQRHVRKYAAGEMSPGRCFFFRGPGDRLKLKAQNLQTFLQLAEGVDDDTWLFHLAAGDYSRWFRDAVGDPELAAVAARVERQRMPARESRTRIREAVEERYTAPA